MLQQNIHRSDSALSWHINRGYKYIMISYDYDSNNILAEPINSRTSLHIKNAYQKMRKFICSRGLTPKTPVLDNK